MILMQASMNHTTVDYKFSRLQENNDKQYVYLN